MKAAVAHVAPSVVRIETVGGLERVGQLLVGTGSTTGLVVVGRRIHHFQRLQFAQKPDSILVTLADGTRLAAKLVATDHDRKLVLLKVHPPSRCRARSRAAGRDPRRPMGHRRGPHVRADAPSMSVGIVSALERIWGKAIQTDAKVSPSNYGGPLVDISGRVLGVLVPLSPDSAAKWPASNGTTRASASPCRWRR